MEKSSTSTNAGNIECSVKKFRPRICKIQETPTSSPVIGAAFHPGDITCTLPPPPDFE